MHMLQIQSESMKIPEFSCDWDIRGKEGTDGGQKTER